MNVIKTADAAKMVASSLSHYVLTNVDLMEKCTGPCSVVVGIEPLCHKACKQLKTDKYSVNLGEARIKFPTLKSSTFENIRGAFGVLYACVMNSHAKNPIKSSYDPGGKVNMRGNRRGCLGFDVTKMRRFFKKEKTWARYYVAIDVGGFSDEENEFLARRGIKLLDGAIEELKSLPMNFPVEKTEIYKMVKQEAAAKTHHGREIPKVDIVIIND